MCILGLKLEACTCVVRCHPHGNITREALVLLLHPDPEPAEAQMATADAGWGLRTQAPTFPGC